MHARPELLEALTEEYLNVFIANPKADTAEVVKLKGYVTEGMLDNPMGFKFSEVLHNNAMARVHPEDRDNFLKALSPDNLIKAFSDGRKRLEFTYRLVENGEVRHFSARVGRISAPGEELQVIAGFRDVESVYNLEAERREEGIRSAYTAISSIFFSVHRVNVQEGTVYPIKSTPTIRKFAIPNSNDYDTNAYKIISGVSSTWSRDDALKFVERSTLPQRLADTDHISMEFISYANDLCKLHFFKEDEDESGNLLHAIFAVEKVNEERTQAVIAALSREYQNVFVLDLEKGTSRVLKITRSFDSEMREGPNKLFAYEDVFRENIVKYAHPEDLGALEKSISLEHLREFFMNQDENEELDGTFRILAGEEVHHLRYACYKLYNLNSLLVGFRNIDDIIERHTQEQAREREKEREHQEQLAQALAAAQQASKAKSTFLTSMSHDIRTPMNAIIGFTALAQTHLDDKEQVSDYLAKISTSSTHLLSLINDILDMSRIESGMVKLDEKPVHIPDLLHDLRAMIQGLVSSKNQNLYIDTQDVVHEDVITDRLRLNQVMINIVGNAVKYTRPGGDIIIHLAEKPCSKRNYRTYEFSVKDTGIGMSEEFRKHIFETFTREYSSTVSGVQGTGLGMAITKNIIDMMGGEITVESEEGKGSLFKVTLSLKLADNKPIQNKPIPALMGARALVVDDDMNTCRSISKMLREIKMRPDWTASGKEAVVRAQDAAEMKDEYKVYIIDYLMPDMNGIETVRRIRRVISEDVPIIVLTAYDWADFEYEAREAGVTAFVSKPLFMSELRSVLTQHGNMESEADSAGAAASKKSKASDSSCDCAVFGKSDDYAGKYSGKHVLLVEDNELNREIATAILGETGMKVDVAVDGAEAVEIMFAADENEYDLIFMDIQMPKMDGYTATHEIRTLPNNKKANIPIVAMTANAFEEDRKKSIEAGMDGHIVKPINLDEIMKVIDRIFDGE